MGMGCLMGNMIMSLPLCQCAQVLVACPVVSLCAPIPDMTARQVQVCTSAYLCAQCLFLYLTLYPRETRFYVCLHYVQSVCTSHPPAMFLPGRPVD